MAPAGHRYPTTPDYLHLLGRRKIPGGSHGGNPEAGHFIRTCASQILLKIVKLKTAPGSYR
jgi:hypothetical protein